MYQQSDESTGYRIGHVFLRIPFVSLGDVERATRFAAENLHSDPLQDFIPRTDGADEQEGNQVTKFSGISLMVKDFKKRYEHQQTKQKMDDLVIIIPFPAKQFREPDKIGHPFIG